jgi:hypothetical protein
MLLQGLLRWGTALTSHYIITFDSLMNSVCDSASEKWLEKNSEETPFNKAGPGGAKSEEDELYLEKYSSESRPLS